MTSKFNGFGTLLVAFILGTLYAALMGLITYPLRASLISWPIWIILFWLMFAKFNLLRFAKYLTVLPLSVLIFEVARTNTQPSTYAFHYLVLDRSHYQPSTRLSRPNSPADNPEDTVNNLKEIYIGEDGFRADPETGQGNPTRCQHVLIGDSMIFGAGLPYPATLRPVLEKMAVNACVFGVTGNSPVDYLATLNYVQDRIDNGARIAIYVYTYNDFVSMTKYLERGLRGSSDSFFRATVLLDYYDDWRRTTFVQETLRKITAVPRPPLRPWHIGIGNTGEIDVYWPHDPSLYPTPRPLDRAQRATFQFFLQRLQEVVANRRWQVSIVFIPDNEEILANLAHRSRSFQDLDPRRVEALKICASLWSDCRDLTRYLFERVIAERQSPYLLKDRHLSLFGNRVVAEHYVSITRKTHQSKQPAQNPIP
jgi:hypothetical protein